MRLNKIEIKIANKRHFADVALLVDKDSFLSQVYDLRGKWKISNFFNDYVEFYSHIWKQGKAKAWENFNKDIEQVRTSFERLPNFDEIILCAIAFNEIPEEVYSSCYLETVVNPDDPEDESKYKYAIIVTPDTTVGDIRTVLSSFKKTTKAHLKQANNKEEREKAVAKYEYEFGPIFTPSPKNIDNIKRDRDWYWLHRKHISYKKILDIAIKQREAISKDGLRKAIKAYEKKLSKK